MWYAVVNRRGTEALRVCGCELWEMGLLRRSVAIDELRRQSRQNSAGEVEREHGESVARYLATDTATAEPSETHARNAAQENWRSSTRR